MTEEVLCKNCSLPIVFNKATKKWESDNEWRTICSPELSGFKEANVHIPPNTVVAEEAKQNPPAPPPQPQPVAGGIWPWIYPTPRQP